ncbi:CatB-related O-acetyltransferase [Mesorhizobium sp. ANAO-SY3R2]|uniref:CatB-related O-acetyltransferase n=1 Tax=Mesorhizobium sp. ANAO-SY3R2 TaxID=3166644 RepID=UPI0036702B75
MRLGLKKRDPSAMPASVTVGRGTYGVSKEGLYNCFPTSPVSIGAFCSIAREVLFMCQGNHPTHTAATYPFQNKRFKTQAIDEYLQTNGPIVVGNDVWIGARAIIMSGVTIGDGAVVAAGSIVTKDVAAYTIVGGNPAKFIRRRFPEDIADAMQAIRWWDWPDEMIAREQASFDLPAEAFVAKYRR